MGKPLVVREYRGEEAELVLDLWRQAEATVSATDTIADIHHLTKENSAILLVAEKAGGIVGSVIGGFDGWRGNIYR